MGHAVHLHAGPEGRPRKPEHWKEKGIAEMDQASLEGGWREDKPRRHACAQKDEA